MHSSAATAAQDIPWISCTRLLQQLHRLTLKWIGLIKLISAHGCIFASCCTFAILATSDCTLPQHSHPWVTLPSPMGDAALTRGRHIPHPWVTQPSPMGDTALTNGWHSPHPWVTPPSPMCDTALTNGWHSPYPWVTQLNWIIHYRHKLASYNLVQQCF